MADALHAIIEADRTVYSGRVVNRLQDEEQVTLASEPGEDDRALPLLAQLFRMGAELAAEMTDENATRYPALHPSSDRRATARYRRRASLCSAPEWSTFP